MKRIFIASLLSLACATAQADEPRYAAPYDGIQAGLDSYALGEARREEQINRQLSANEQMRWWRGLPPSYAPSASYRYPPSLDYVYVTGRRGLFGRYRERVYFGTADVFAPWPYVPGDVWGSVDTSGVRHPSGQRHTQTGPNRWESHPVYDEPARVAESPFEAPILEDDSLPSTAREF